LLRLPPLAQRVAEMVDLLTSEQREPIDRLFNWMLSSDQ
jgi:hypothetical protein